MFQYIIKRLLYMIPVLLCVIIIVFTILYFTPGDPARILLGVTATEEQLAAKRAELGLDQSYIVQLFTYIKNLVLHFDFGTSYSTGLPVKDEIIARFPNTVKIAFVSIVLATVLGVVFGVISAIRQYSAFDVVATVVGLAGVSMPSFWLALMLILLFSVKLAWLPSSGLDTFSAWILPSIALGLNSMAMIMRMTRSSMLDVIRQDYIRTARAKGQSERNIIFKHALKNALIPIITVVGLQFGGLLGGSVAIETIFSIAGTGYLSTQAILARNTPVVMGCVLLVSAVFCVLNLLTDILYTFADPRLRPDVQRRRGKKALRSQTDVFAGGENNA